MRVQALTVARAEEGGTGLTTPRKLQCQRKGPSSCSFVENFSCNYNKQIEFSWLPQSNNVFDRLALPPQYILESILDSTASLRRAGGSQTAPRPLP